VQFEMAEMAEAVSTDLPVPRVVVPEIFPPFSDEDSATDPTAVHKTDLSDEMMMEEMPAAAPTATVPAESSGILIIPDVEALVAMTTAAPASPPVSVRLPTPIPPPPERPEPSPAEPAPAPAADGLPELAGLFNADAILGIEEAAEGHSTGAAANVFEAEPPVEEPVALDLPFPVALPAWAPDELARALGGTQSTTLSTPATDRHYWRDQVALAGDELAAAKEEKVSAPALAHLAVAAARACEQAGQLDGAQRLYEEAVTHDPDCLPALRALLRLRPPGSPSEAARDWLTALARVSEDERPAYDTLLAEAAGAETGAPLNEGAPTRALAAADRALRAASVGDAAEALATAGRQFGGALGASLLVEAARLRELAGEGAAAAALRGEARALHPAEVGVALGELRRAVGLRPEEAAAVIDAVGESLPAGPLRAAALRWGARLARSSGDPGRAQALLGRAAQASLGLPERDRIALEAPGPGLSPAGRVLAALRAAGAHAEAGRREEALELLRTELEGQPDAVPLALAAEALGRAAKDPWQRADAWATWAAGDPARSGFAHRLRADVLADDPAEAIDALAEASAASPLDPVFWELAWARLRRQERGPAAAALDAGAGAWAASPGAERLAAAIDERATELRRAADPGEAVSALAPAAGGPDDPAALVTRMLDAEAAPEAIADLLRAEAPPGLTHRALEAAGWMLRAGQGGQALSWLLERRKEQEGRPLPGAMAQLVRRLARLHGEPAARAQLLADLSEAEPAESERQALELQRAEALESAGDRGAAAEIYRALLAGPFAADADLALRRVLWSARDAATLGPLYRDEADAQRGASRPAAAAATLVEQACVHADLGQDLPAARQALLAARHEDSGNSEARMSLLADAARGGRFVEVLPLLEEAGTRDFPAAATAILSLAGLIDAHRTGDQQAARLLREAMAHHPASDPTPINLLLRKLHREMSQAPASAAVADHLEEVARVVKGLPGHDPRTVATLLLRAAEIREGLREIDRAEVLLREATERDPECLPALMRLRRLLVNREQWSPAAEIAEAEAAAAARPEHRAQAWLTAAAIAEYKLDDRKRAVALLRKVLEGNPSHPEAFARIRTLLEAQSDGNAVAELLTVRLRAAANPEQAAALRVEKAALLAGSLGDRKGAKEELRSLINEQPQNADGLYRLATLELEDGAYAVAAELFIRQARFDRDPERLRDIFLQIGRIYLRRLPDHKLATGAFERVLRLEGENREALEALSELYTKQNEIRKALSVTEPLIEAESDPQKRLVFLLRVATLWEKSGDVRRASGTLKRAAEESPRNLQAVGELARFYERTKETMARNVLLDGSIGILRADMRKDPRDLEGLRTIIPLLRWRHRPACSAAAAQLLAAFTDDPAEKTEAAGWSAPPAGGRRLTALANPDLEEIALPPQVPRGVRNVMRILGPTLARASKPNLKRWEVGRGERQPAGSGLRAIADVLAVDLGVRNFELYVSTARPRALAVETGDPPAVIIGAELAALGAPAVRFASGYALRLIATNFDVLALGSAIDAGVLLAGIVRQFVPDFRHPELSEADVVASSARVAKAMPKALRGELAPFAAEIATPLATEAFLLAVQETAARVGLLAAGDLGASLAVLCAAHGQPPKPGGALAVPAALALIDFALSEEHEQLVAALDAVS
jgi:tetratricopeptide (TPR) repeat protein